MSFSEERRSVPAPKLQFPVRYNNHELRFHAYNQPERPGWGIRAGERTLRKEDDDATQPMSGEGLMRVMEDLDGRSFPPRHRPAAVGLLDGLSRNWLRGDPFDRATILSQDLLVGGSGSSSDHPPDWLPHAIGVLVLAFVVLVLALTGKATMGGDLPGDQ
jgi:hypothetical protein